MKSKPRNYTRRKLHVQKEKEKEDARNAKITKEAENQKVRDAKITKNTKNTSAGSSQPPPNNVTQQPGEAQPQLTPEPHYVSVSTSSTAPATSPVTSRWTRFRPSGCCTSTQNIDGVEVHEHRTAVVDVPLAQSRPRNYTRRQLQRKKEKEKEEARNAKIAKEAENQKARDAKIAKNMKNASAGSSQPPPNNVIQQPGEAQPQPTPEPHSVGVSTSSTAPATSPVTSCWTRFRSAGCCTSTQNIDGDR
ncbi:hypothetical protein M405DRAFT_862724 [Rhizopogon salebrosus TDB-379]|nr:hypothetical protein M405DRAFT_862724 [Rhizopogon salebrosus TDB-379]